MDPTNARGCHPWLAAAMSLACPGLGQVYAGRVARGLALLLLTWLLVPAAALLAAFGGAVDPRLVGLLGAAIASLLLIVFAVVDAAILAARAEPAAGPWNRPLVYGLLLVLGVVGSAASTMAVRTHLYHGYVVAAGSMAPTFHPGDRVLARCLGAGRRPPAPGRIIVFRSPADREQVLVKRVAAAPDVPPDHVWVLGDAADNSLDSRSFGPVPVGDVLGEVQYVFWPPDRFGAMTPGPGP